MHFLLCQIAVNWFCNNFTNFDVFSYHQSAVVAVLYIAVTHIYTHHIVSSILFSPYLFLWNLQALFSAPFFLSCTQPLSVHSFHLLL